MLDKEIAVCSLGAGVSVGQTILLREYVDVTFGEIPFIPIEWTPWNRWSTLGNIAIGIPTMLLGISGKLNNPILSSFLATYGTGCTFGGILNGVFPKALTARAGMRFPARRPVVARRPVARRLVAKAPQPARLPPQSTITSIPSTVVLA